MKNPLLIILFVLSSVLLVVPFVHATANSTGDIVITTISSQNFSGLPNKDFDGTFTVMNNGTQLKTVRISHTGLGTLELTFSPERFDLLAGQSRSVQFTIDSEPSHEGFITGTISAVADSSHKDFFSLTVNLSTVGSELAAVRRAYLGGRELRQNANASAFFYPGELVDLAVDVENNYKKLDDPHLESFRTFDVIFEDFHEESSTDFEPDFDVLEPSIAPQSVQQFRSKQFRIPFDAPQNKTYKLTMDIEVEDSENRVFPINYTAFIVIDRSEDRVGFSEFTLSKDKLSCGETFTIALTFVNLGDFAVRNANFVIENDKIPLYYNSSLYQLTPKENDRRQDYVYEVRQNLPFTIPLTTPPGIYSLTAKTYIDNKKSEAESHTFEVVSCAGKTESAESSAESTATPSPPENQNQSATPASSSGSPTTAAPPSTSPPEETTSLSLDSIDRPLNTRSIIIAIVVGIIILLVLLLGILAVVLYHGNTKQSSQKSEKSKKLMTA